MKKLFTFLRRAFLWVANIRLWQFGGVLLLIVVGVLLWMRYSTPGGVRTKPESDTLIDIVKVDKKLDVFRNKWDIYGRFEAWPALLPLAEMSKAAYSTEAEIKDSFQKFGLDGVVALKSPFHSQFAYVAHGEDVSVVVFRGTDDAEDWLTNVNAYTHDMVEGSLHSGFGNAYGTLQSQVWREIETKKPKHLWITGHSLGGALALVCAYDLVVYRDLGIDGVITFGQPKIAKYDLSNNLQRRLGDRYVHFVNELDGVPQLPPRFSHCGLLLWFHNGKVEKEESYFRFAEKRGADDNEPVENGYVPVEQLPEMSKKEFEEFKRAIEHANPPANPPVKPLVAGSPPTYGGPFPRIGDHSMTHYVKKIRDAIDKAEGR